MKDTIPARTYPSQDAAIQIVSIWNVLLANEKMSDQVAYDFVRAIFERKEDLVRVHSEARNFDFKYQTPYAAALPFHPGARRYLVEKGVNVN